MQAQPQDIQQQIEQLQERLDSLQETLNANAPSDLARDQWGDVGVNSILYKDPMPPGYLDSDLYKLAAEIDDVGNEIGQLRNDLDRKLQAQQVPAQQVQQVQPTIQAQTAAMPLNPPAASVNASVAASFYADPAKQQAKAALGPQPGSLTAAQAASYYADPAKQQAGGGSTTPSVRDILRGAASGISNAANSVKETIQAKLGLLSNEDKMARVDKQIEKRNDHGNDLRARREELFNGRPPVPNNRADRDQLIQSLKTSLDNPQLTDPSQKKDLVDKLDKCNQANKLDERIDKNESKVEGLTQKKEDLQAKLKTGASLPANANSQGPTTAMKVR